ncbi:hypothetical protein GCM10023192_69510 [Amycolatopsis samaneae]
MERQVVSVREWPRHAGPEGISARAAAASPTDVSGARAAAALGAWSPDRAPESFPYQEVLDHFVAVGRMYAGERVTAPLRAIAVRVPADSWPLPLWLPSTVDQHNSTYDGYLLTRLLLSVVDLDDERSVGGLLGGLVADTLLAEAAMLRSTPGRVCRARTAAVASVLGRLSSSDGAAPADDREFADHAGRLATAFLAGLGREQALVIGIALLPITRMHDEHMFFRCVQIFEMIYAYLCRRIELAGVALLRGEIVAAGEQLDRAIWWLGLSRPLYRVLTTMPRRSFEIIRVHSDGRSAVQSRHYRRIELLCAPRPAGPPAVGLPPVEPVGATLQEIFTSIVDSIGRTTVAPLVCRMADLDRAWRAMKRTHWGVTLKIIGDDRGTGGTSGAEYLKRAAEVPLFPALVDGAEWPR